ncbi:LysR family transcriptional regulator [Aureibacter tunicatorum]|uniref:DNA-binding transcriptional LysR family regulator n=1 Tax=Aureibacter tunicatorum TaxID=866807 RepID=A0AAE4BU52_9BACT|nr:LysR substrate-binding domain-containing protein [Aureibacter tunicatorum]MDR6240670.1 DNA-binding transcriptional LysR family regulator [Aureibacter tunicatorum]BDD06997.1 transcriptional regulator [Aureibacter tunicatorum]
MELRHLRYFLAVAEELNFTKAAEKLFISQPPLSRQIKELEEEVGARLFDRNNKSVILTEAGKFFQIEARKILNQLEATTIKTKKIADNISGEYKIAYTSSTFTNEVTRLVNQLTKLFPFLNIKLFEASSSRQVQALEQERLDFGILRAPVMSPIINSNFWYEESFSLVWNDKTIFEKDISKLSKESFIFFNKNYAPTYHQSLMEICSSYGFKPNILHEANNINSIIELVKAGLGISIIPSKVKERYSDLKFLELNPKFHTNVLIATSKNDTSIVTEKALQILLNQEK